MAQANSAGGRLHNNLGNRNLPDQHKSESAGVLSPYSINTLDIGGNSVYGPNHGWYELSFTTGASINTISYISNGIAILGTGNGHVWRSRDFGNSWSDILTIVDDIYTMSYFGNGKAIFGTTSGHIYMSYDYGVIWTDIGLLVGASIDSISYLGDGIAIFGTSDGHIWRSTDSLYIFWTDLGLIPGASVILSTIYLENGVVLLGTSSGRIGRSIDLGLNWNVSIVAGASNILSFCYLGDGVVIFGTNDGHIWRSTDYGSNWIDLTAIAGAHAIDSIVYLGNGIVDFVTDNGRVWRSANYGLSWTSHNIFGTFGNVINTISYLGNGTSLFGTVDGHIWRNDVAYRLDESRTTVHNDLLNRNLIGISAHNSELVGVLSDSAINVKDIGVKWGTPNVIAGNAVRPICYIGSGIVLAGIDDGHLFRSVDYGVTWTDLGTPAGITTIYTICYLGNGIVILGTSGGHEWRSTDFGITWSDIGDLGGAAQPLTSFSYIGNGVVIVTMIGSLAPITTGFIQRSTDFGLTWAIVRADASKLYLTSTYLENGTVLAGRYDGNLFRSTDFGANWTDLGTIPGATAIRGMCYLGNGIAVFGTQDGHVWRSVNYGLTWTDIGVIQIVGFAVPIRSFSYLGNGIVIAALDSGFAFRSHDYGLTWPDGYVVSNQLVSSCYLGNGIILIGATNGSVTRSDVSYKLDESSSESARIDYDLGLNASHDINLTATGRNIKLDAGDNIIFQDVVAGLYTLHDIVNNIGYWRNFHHGDIDVTNGLWVWTNNIGQTTYSSDAGAAESAGYFENTTTHADGDLIQWNVYLPAGTYSYYYVYSKGPNRGRIGFYVSPTLVSLTDFYKLAPQTYNDMKSGTFTISSFGSYTIMFRCDNKNVASTNYYIGFSKFVIERTGLP
jgi:photosystem II stability/assembly factor-like uncharacterized protein